MPDETTDTGSSMLSSISPEDKRTLVRVLGGTVGGGLLGMLAGKALSNTSGSSGLITGGIMGAAAGGGLGLAVDGSIDPTPSDKSGWGTFLKDPALAIAAGGTVGVGSTSADMFMHNHSPAYRSVMRTFDNNVNGVLNNHTKMKTNILNNMVNSGKSGTIPKMEQFKYYLAMMGKYKHPSITIGTAVAAWLALKGHNSNAQYVDDTPTA